MHEDVAGQIFEGLERLCVTPEANRILSAPAYPGIERIQAQFRGDAFELHRHDTYALGVTMRGVQTFRYRGEQRYSLPGRVIILHPDELHDGGAATEDGLVYRMLYLEPSVLFQCLEAARVGLPFVDDPVVEDNRLAGLLLAALGELDRELDELFVDDFVSRLTDGLVQHARLPQRRLGSIAWGQVKTARDYIEAHVTRGVRSQELERITGLDRFALARHFRAAFATSPHRFLLMRRLQQAKAMIAAGEPIAEVAAATGFADQSHLTRHFKKAFGIAPGVWNTMVQRAG
ncbi:MULTISPECIES: AraC family transcriptional regulator [unclassified Rhizobium]|uniref:AraC family transcriptional regulator n=1 Tax=unclassified Rhizobium TaxID=2613769 RepID=UPI00084C1C76|nr:MULTISPECIES: AraC family transcriptional regulator [unclassified Rhizobium]OEC98118.1 AraC family transcriptional regulator [Rhizobium sp. YK2]QYA11340.1 AraC family transcriptional regulator [Rhizobium sp. AB2/73]UEQ82730.1 AraC family transcriptional regulator [Rhizobium sp. AB2/73]